MANAFGQQQKGGNAARIAMIVFGVIIAIGGIMQFSKGFMSLTSASTADAGIKTASQNATTAAQKFVDMTKDVYRTGNKAPRLTDATVSGLLNTVFDTSILKTKTPTKADLGPIADWGLAINKVGTVYLTAGSGVADIQNLPNDPAVLQRINGNVAIYAPEFGRYLDSEVLVSGSLAQALPRSPSEASENAQVKEGLAKMRAGITQTVGGALSTVATPGLDDPWRRDRLGVLKDEEPSLVKFLLPAQCKQLSDIAGQVSGAVDGGVKADADTFAAAMKC